MLLKNQQPNKQLLIMYHILLFISLYATPYKMLTWEDYTGKPDSIQMAQGYSAMTGYEWHMEVSVIDGKCTFNIDCRLMPEKCWTITSDLATLKHERIHWMITQLWCNKLKKKLAPFDMCPESQYKKAKKIYDYCWKEQERLQDLYDHETRHGVNAAMQKQWEEQIRKEL